MSTTQPNDADHEILSALFDGELDGDAARFALKRLDHDAQWRETCGRWQLGGDVLRGQAGTVAPAGFADRVRAAMVEDAETEGADTQVARHAATPAGVAPVRRSWSRGWIGGAALAASVAIAALFVVQPFTPSGDVPSTAPQIAAASPTGIVPADDSAPVASQLAVQGSGDPAPDTPPSAPGVEIGLAAAAVAVTEVPRRTNERRSRGQSQRAAARSSRDTVVSPMVVGARPDMIASTVDPMPAAPAAIEPSSTHPFMPQGEIVARPWPRAVLPGYPSGNAFTASFERTGGSGASSPEASSFYPFEPRALGAGPSSDAGSDWPPRR